MFRAIHADLSRLNEQQICLGLVHNLACGIVSLCGVRIRSGSENVSTGQAVESGFVWAMCRSIENVENSQGLAMIRETAIWGLGILWLALVAGGMWAWERFDTTPGSTGTETVVADDAISGRWQLIVFVHPQCPCSGATLEELAEIVPRPRTYQRVLWWFVPQGCRKTARTRRCLTRPRDPWRRVGERPRRRRSSTLRGGNLGSYGAHRRTRARRVSRRFDACPRPNRREPRLSSGARLDQQARWGRPMPGLRVSTVQFG